MLLTVNIGNTNMMIGGFEKQTLLFESCIKTDLIKTEHEYAVLLRNILDIYEQDSQKLEGGIVASVVPQLTDRVGKAIRLLKKIKVLYVGPGIKTGLNIKIDDPAQLGANLAATAIGVIEKYPLPAVIIDMDTATSFTLVDKDKCLRGGAIVPGVITSLNALSSRAAQLPSISLDSDVKLIGTNTIDSMKSGIVLGTASMIDGMLERFTECFDEPITVVACGPTADRIIPFCRKEIVIDQKILMEGLCAIYYKNCPLKKKDTAKPV